MKELDLTQGCKAFDRYFNTLLQVGTISSKETHEALIYTFITNCYLTNKFPTLNAMYRSSMFNALNCIYNNSCIFKK